MKPLHVAFIWHMHQPHERKPQVSAHRAARMLAVLLTFGLWFLIYEAMSPYDAWWRKGDACRGRGELARQNHVMRIES